MLRSIVGRLVRVCCSQQSLQSTTTQQRSFRSFSSSSTTTVTTSKSMMTTTMAASLLEEVWRAERRSATSSVRFGHEWRSHHCADCNTSLIGSNSNDAGACEVVTLCGWVHHFRSLGAVSFIVLRDDTGLVQVKCSRDVLQLQSTDGGESVFAPTLESVVQVRGRVVARPQSQVKGDASSSGAVEIEASSVRLITAASTPLPLPVGETVGEAPREEARLRHRYLDLRSVGMQERLQMRSAVLHAARSTLIDNGGFTEVETPTLFRRTSEGAREFLVPTRQRNRFYALPQSPQQYKQMLVIGGIARYFQVARCYRDESTRADRQPEFTQVCSFIVIFINNFVY